MENNERYSAKSWAGYVQLPLGLALPIDNHEEYSG